MTNEQLIKERWRYTDKLLKQHETKFKVIFSDIKDELTELFNELDIKRDDLSKIVPNDIKRKYERKKREWKKDGLLVGYFNYLVSTTTKLTYQNLLNLFVYGIYMKYQKQEFDEAKELLVGVANDCYKQAKKEIKEVPKDIPKDLSWRMINDWIIIQTLNLPVYEYMLLLTQTAQEEAYKMLLNSIYQEVPLSDSGLSKLIEKQQHRLIYINGDKSSGMLENASIQAGNKAYFELFPNELVEFVAIVDDRTTEMCLSLDGQVFNTKNRNVFERYSDFYGGVVKYDFDGLIEGINLPPISDHFHWCRSTIKAIDKYEFIDSLRNIKSVYQEEIKDKSGGKEVGKANGWTLNDGTFLPLEKGKVFFRKEEIEKNTEMSNWLSEITGRQLDIQPSVLDPKNIKTPDAKWVDNDVNIEFKEFDIKVEKYDSTKNYIDAKLGNGYGQASEFVIDISNSPINAYKAIKDLDAAMNYGDREFVEKVYLKDGNELIDVFVRK